MDFVKLCVSLKVENCLTKMKQSYLSTSVRRGQYCGYSNITSNNLMVVKEGGNFLQILSIFVESNFNLHL